MSAQIRPVNECSSAKPGEAARAGLRKPAAWLAAACLALAVGVAGAADAPLVNPDRPQAAVDPAIESKVNAITAELRCLVCQNQTIADSNADLAVDLRNQVREMVRRGDSQEKILAYMTARYGDFVLYRPPVKSTTALLWFGPAALLVVAVGVFLIVLRRRTRMSADRFEPDPDEA